MNKTEDQSPDPAAAAGQKSDLDEARSLFEKMVGEAKREAERGQAEVRSRSPFAKLLLALAIIAALLAVATAVYGVINFPDAPLRKTPFGYLGRVGTPHTKEEFETFLRWQQAMFFIFPAVFVFAFGYLVTEKLRRSRRGDDRQAS